MPRVSKPLILKDEQKTELQALTKSPDAQMSLRARIVLECAEENENKKVAIKLGTSEGNVAKWKEQFRRHGIEAISKSQKTGRPAGAGKDTSLTEKIQEFTQLHPDTWTASDLAEKFDVSLNDVYYAMRKAGISPNQRTRAWTYRTTEAVSDGQYYLIGLYLSAASKAVMTAKMKEPLDGDILHGSVTTSNSALYRQMEGSEEPLSAGDAAAAFSSHMDYVSRGKKPDPGTVIREISESWLQKYADRIYVFSQHGTDQKSLSYDSDRITLSETESDDAWIGEIFLWNSDTLSQEEREDADRTLGIISRYIRTIRDTSEPFIWRLLPDTQEKLPDDTKQASPSASSLEEIERAAAAADEKAGGGIEISADLRIGLGNGRVYHQVIRADGEKLNTEDFDFSTMESFEKGINALDRAMDSFARKVDKDGRAALLEGLKKNRTAPE